MSNFEKYIYLKKEMVFGNVILCFGCVLYHEWMFWVFLRFNVIFCLYERITNCFLQLFRKYRQIWKWYGQTQATSAPKKGLGGPFLIPNGSKKEPKSANANEIGAKKRQGSRSGDHSALRALQKRCGTNFNPM